MMSPGVSPAPSDVPVNKDDAGDGDRQDDLGLNVIDNGIIANNEGDESESSSDENGDEVYNEHSYNGYIALEQQSVDTVAGDDGDVSWVSNTSQIELFTMSFCIDGNRRMRKRKNSNPHYCQKH